MKPNNYRVACRTLALIVCLLFVPHTNVDAVRGSGPSQSEIEQSWKKTLDEAQKEIKREQELKANKTRVRFINSVLRKQSSASTLAPVFLIDWLPKTTEEFKDVYGQSISSDQTEGEQASKELESFTGSRAHPIDLEATRTILQGVSNTHRFVIFLGHNVDGVFHLPGNKSGIGVPISELVRSCVKATILCVFVSCSSAQYLSAAPVPLGTAKPLDFKKAIQLTQFTAREFESLNEVIVRGRDLDALRRSLEETLNRVDRELRKESPYRKITFFIVNGFIVALLLSSDDESTQVAKSLPANMTIERTKREIIFWKSQ